MHHTIPIHSSSFLPRRFRRFSGIILYRPTKHHRPSNLHRIRFGLLRVLLPRRFHIFHHRRRTFNQSNVRGTLLFRLVMNTFNHSSTSTRITHRHPSKQRHFLQLRFPTRGLILSLNVSLIVSQYPTFIISRGVRVTPPPFHLCVRDVCE